MTARRIFWPALVVALGAAAATAHGLYEVAVASRVPAGIAWLYPVITDGLALVAYAATRQLRRPAARGYAWFVVVVAAGLSGLAQAVLLASDDLIAPAAVRFGIGAWPAVAAAVVAHLLYLLADDDRAQQTGHVDDVPAVPPAEEPWVTDWWADAPAYEIAEQAEEIAAGEDVPAARTLTAVPDPTPTITPAIEALARKARVAPELAARVEAYLAQVAAQGEPTPGRRAIAQALGLGPDNYDIRKIMEARAA